MSLSTPQLPPFSPSTTEAQHQHDELVADELTDDDSNVEDARVSTQRSTLITQLRERRNLLRARAEMLLQQMPARASLMPSSSSAAPNHHVHQADVFVLARELERCAWNPVMELAHLVFTICSRLWEAEHQRKSANLCAFYASRDNGRREQAWAALISGQIDQVPRSVDDSTAIYRGRGMSSSPPRAHSAATALWEAVLIEEQCKLAYQSASSGITSHVVSNTRRRDIPSSWAPPQPLGWNEVPFKEMSTPAATFSIEDADLADDDDEDEAAELEALVALKYAENCAARRPMYRAPLFATRLSSLLKQ